MVAVLNLFKISRDSTFRDDIFLVWAMVIPISGLGVELQYNTLVSYDTIVVHRYGRVLRACLRHAF